MDRIDSRELSEWMAYYSLEPWGPERGDLQAGIISATVANGIRAFGKRRGKAATPQDFMPDFVRARKRQSVEDIKRYLQAFTASFDG